MKVVHSPAPKTRLEHLEREYRKSAALQRLKSVNSVDSINTPYKLLNVIRDLIEAIK